MLFNTIKKMANYCKEYQKQNRSFVSRGETYLLPPSAPYVPKYEEILNAPHTLIAGTTGSGKSVVINGIMHTALALYGPGDAVFMLVDPKRVELRMYKDLPHVVDYMTTSEEVVDALARLSDFMRNRLDDMAKRGLYEWDGYQVYFVIDELADLMISRDRAKVKMGLQEILQLGRAAGIHIIAATQAPNRKIIPAELVLNFTNRIALRCLSAIESRQICNKSGAETISEYGKALYLSPKGFEWLNGIPYFNRGELQERVNWWMNQAA